MSSAPQTMEELNQLLTSSPSPAALLEALMDIEGDISLQFGNTHFASDTEFLRTYYSAYFFALLLRGEMYVLETSEHSFASTLTLTGYSNEAHMLTRRIPRSLVIADAVLQNTLNLLQAVWNKEHAVVYQVLRESPWPDVLRPLAEAYFTYFRDKTVNDLSMAYGAIRPETAASYLGVDLNPVQGDTMVDVSDSAISELIAALTEKGWEFDSETKLLKPVPSATAMTVSELDKAKIGHLAALFGTHGD
ncbi:hypothetical protein PRK78_003938 [Emydomyces testavorans]|uniref:CSN8/PSMD8/EIF3K domain-containing protein n=1 Tax=Emydomyces testavorans TaxID=2070801 RepID=A0AAF0DH55_9EURO|nr:hypothetical protein PRK78_003938 [Emydomyces testavorans]